MLYSIGTLVEGRLREKETGKKKDAHILSPSMFPVSPFPQCQLGSKQNPKKEIPNAQAQL